MGIYNYINKTMSSTDTKGKLILEITELQINNPQNVNYNKINE